MHTGDKGASGNKDLKAPADAGAGVAAEVAESLLLAEFHDIAVGAAELGGRLFGGIAVARDTMAFIDKVFSFFSHMTTPTSVDRI